VVIAEKAARLPISLTIPASKVPVDDWSSPSSSAPAAATTSPRPGPHSTPGFRSPAPLSPLAEAGTGSISHWPPVGRSNADRAVVPGRARLSPSAANDTSPGSTTVVTPWCWSRPGHAGAR
jgi:hypothetical protein